MFCPFPLILVRSLKFEQCLVSYAQKIVHLFIAKLCAQNAAGTKGSALLCAHKFSQLLGRNTSFLIKLESNAAGCLIYRTNANFFRQASQSESTYGN